ncbi:hypothetical protein LCGC14_2284190 [marine sediment metagenome]|uniref:Uncharacterized protein n=1 Tax=marine sediment metagenome TaxID=412755 RepID=A0A0F9F5N8_9ZZZZ
MPTPTPTPTTTPTRSPSKDPNPGPVPDGDPEIYPPDICPQQRREVSSPDIAPISIVQDIIKIVRRIFNQQRSLCCNTA